MKKFLFIAALALGIIVAFEACQSGNVVAPEKKLNLPAQTLRYADISLPAHLGGVRMGDLGVNDDGATLGRVLFYDGKLSLNNQIACASCHKQAYGFSDITQYSKGFEGAVTTRNSMPIVNPVLNSTLFWDSRANSIEDLALRPVKNHIEMGMESMKMLTQKLTNTSYYPALFEKAFGTSEVTEERIQSAMAQFMRTIITGNSKYDEGVDDLHANFTPLEKLGYDIFTSDKAKCSSCHMEPTFAPSGGGNMLMLNNNVFNDPTSNFMIEPGGGMGNPYSQTLGTTNIGLDRVYADQGMGDGHFRIPSLRNIELTAPYMHDGRFNKLEEVVEHYNSGIQAHPKLDHKFRDVNGNPTRLNLTEVEKQALVAFLKTLTDRQMCSDVRYSNPFSN